MVDSKCTDANKSVSGYKDRPWIPRFWDGMNVSGWFSVLWRNRFAVHPLRIPMLAIICVLSVVNSVLGGLQWLLFGRKIAATQIAEPPVFIVGHWRSGTTMLHEMLVLDPRHTFPSNYECFAPNHFLLSGWLLPKMLGFLMPKQRPMDNMAFGWDRPQEDEFALCNMGVPSPYLTSVFPNRPPQYPEYLDMQGVPPAAQAFWKRKFLWFLRCVTVRSPKRIILKSPPHTARIRLLLELFPGARFVHIVRDPYVVFPSTMNLWKRLHTDEGLQIPRFAHLEQEVFDTLNRMYAAYDRDVGQIPPGHFCEVRYEDLVKDPLGQMRRVYEELGLGDFAQAQPALEAYIASQKDYKTNRYNISPEVCAKVNQHWSAFCAQYGYAPPAVQVTK